MERTLVGNAGDADQIRRGERQVRDKAREQRAELQRVLATRDGRNLLWRLLEHCGLMGPIWEPSARIHYNEGKRAVGIDVKRWIDDANDNAFMQMMQEARIEARKDEIRQSDKKKEEKEDDEDM